MLVNAENSEPTLGNAARCLTPSSVRRAPFQMEMSRRAPVVFSHMGDVLRLMQGLRLSVLPGGSAGLGPHTHLLPCGKINRDAGTNLPIKRPVRLLWVDINDNWQHRSRKG